MKKKTIIGILLCVCALLFFMFAHNVLNWPLFLAFVFALLIAGIGVLFLKLPEEKLQSLWEKILCTFSSKKRQEIEERNRKRKEAEEEAARKREEEARRKKEAEEERKRKEAEEEAARKRKEAEEEAERKRKEAEEERKRKEAEEERKRKEEERKKEEAERKRKEEERKKEEAARKQKEAEEKCAREGHVWVRLPYKKDNFKYKQELFECLPLDGCIDEKCSVCGEKRKTRLAGMRELSVPKKLINNIEYKEKVVGTYELKLDVEKSYCMRAKKDIPSIKIERGKLFLVLEPSNDIYYSEEALSYTPTHRREMADVIHDNGEMPGLVEFDKYIAFVDDDSGDILSSSKIDVDWGDSNLVGTLELGFLEIPDHGSLKVFCLIKDN